MALQHERRFWINHANVAHTAQILMKGNIFSVTIQTLPLKASHYLLTTFLFHSPLPSSKEKHSDHGLPSSSEINLFFTSRLSFAHILSYSGCKGRK